VSIAFGHVQSTVTERFTISTPVSLRKTPDITATGPLTSVGSNGGFALSSFAVLESEPNSVIVSAVSATAHTSGALVMFAAGASGAGIVFDAEL
jgi:hypothetical protein